MISRMIILLVKLDVFHGVPKSLNPGPIVMDISAIEIL
jgi:hypothetical protein